MITREVLKAEIDRVPSSELEILYRIIVALKEEAPKPMSKQEWREEIRKAYGSCAQDPIAREPQGRYEVREHLK